jgi:hypothetical protein
VHVLRPYVERIEGLTALVEAVGANAAAQGVVLDVNPFWLAAYRMARAGLTPWLLEHQLFLPSLLSLLPDDLLSLEAVEGDAIDFMWRDVTGWVETATRRVFHDSRDYAKSTLPFLVKILARPIGPEQAEARALLVRLAASQTFPTIVETRSPGTLALAPGDRCTARGTPGTIGGFLRDRRTGDVYGATCGHVAGTNAQVTVASQHVGTCVHSQPPKQLPAGQLCTRNCPNATRLDFALIDVGCATVTNAVKGLASQIASRQRIALRTGSSVQGYEVGGVAVTYCPGSSNVCFENLFEVRPPSSSGVLNPRVRAVFATVPVQGDSGAWVETVPGAEWCGVLVAADSSMGYALEADDVVAKADAAFGTQLALV